ncbi:MAG TPA: YraN family protein [Candidatus Krumholzibacteria bacterium]|nr:YraN family protein [Candidatus Krumholzibacteria bacterium]HPD71390.1 YraN family protein [Candidatus Krumholzibacteria bacterium]HRY38910.1 YraN family protein [Candidatus Krumholzibacteria bacterium]
MSNADLGRLGEDLALVFLQSCGYTCLARRWRRGGGEVDLVVARSGLVVFVEVKSRGPGSLGTAVQAVSPAQLRRLRAMARRWCWERGTAGASPRLDVVAVDLSGEGRGLVLRHFPGVA